jgi:hypothetical protein
MDWDLLVVEPVMVQMDKQELGLELELVLVMVDSFHCIDTSCLFLRYHFERIHHVVPWSSRCHAENFQICYEIFINGPTIQKMVRDVCC